MARLPDEIDLNEAILRTDAPLTILTTSTPDGRTALLAFTDLEALQAHAPDLPYVAMGSRDVLEVVIDQGYDALIVNAAGPWAGLPREDVLQILNGGWP